VHIAEVRVAGDAKVKNDNLKFDVQSQIVRPKIQAWDHSDTGVLEIMKSGVRFNDGRVDGIIYGGSYRDAPRHLPGVNMAMELGDRYSDVFIPTRDFASVNLLLEGMWRSRYLLAKHGSIYAGCMGGTGRTGLFMAAMLLWADMTTKWIHPHQRVMARNAIAEVRRQYRPHAVETAQQRQFLEELPLRRMAWKAWGTPVF
jgi:hypothetical protein